MDKLITLEGGYKDMYLKFKKRRMLTISAAVVGNYTSQVAYVVTKLENQEKLFSR